MWVLILTLMSTRGVSIEHIKGFSQAGCEQAKAAWTQGIELNHSLKTNYITPAATCVEVQ